PEMTPVHWWTARRTTSGPEFERRHVGAAPALARERAVAAESFQPTGAAALDDGEGAVYGVGRRVEDGHVLELHRADFSIDDPAECLKGQARGVSRRVKSACAGGHRGTGGSAGQSGL